MPLFVLVINATLCHTSLIPFSWVCGLVLAVYFTFRCMATDLLARGALDSHWLFESVLPFVVMDAAANVCMRCCLSSWIMCAGHVRERLGSISVFACQQQGEWKGKGVHERQPRARAIL